LAEEEDGEGEEEEKMDWENANANAISQWQMAEGPPQHWGMMAPLGNTRVQHTHTQYAHWERGLLTIPNF
jgi:hypothetical protein